MCERASELWKFEMYEHISFSLLSYYILYTIYSKKYNQNLWGPMGSHPLCPLLIPALHGAHSGGYIVLVEDSLWCFWGTLDIRNGDPAFLLTVLGGLWFCLGHLGYLFVYLSEGPIRVSTLSKGGPNVVFHCLHILWIGDNIPWALSIRVQYTPSFWWSGSCEEIFTYWPVWDFFL